MESNMTFFEAMGITFGAILVFVLFGLVVIGLVFGVVKLVFFLHNFIVDPYGTYEELENDLEYMKESWQRFFDEHGRK